MIGEVLQDRLLTWIFVAFGVISSRHLTPGSPGAYWARIGMSLSRLVLLVASLYYFQLMVVDIVYSKGDLDDDLIFIYCLVCLSVQYLLLIAEADMVQRRVEIELVSKVEAQYFTQAKPIFFGFLLFMVALMIFYPAVSLATGSRSTFVTKSVALEWQLYFPIYFISQLYTIVYLAATLMVIVAEGTFSAHILRELYEASKNEALSTYDLKVARTTIYKMRTAYATTGGAICWIALFNAIAFILRIYIDYRDWQSSFAALGFYGKELPFAALISYYAACVNDLEDELMLSFSQQEWVGEQKEMQRLKMLAVEAGSPISFLVLNRRVGRRQLMIEVTGVLGSVMVAVLRVLLYATRYNPNV
ncbi:hypothetical protein EON65_42905 [archaeon]|nr:MAG: hypothetical protein EON65_42905 [archaeon]